MNSSEIVDQQITISNRIDALLHLLPRDDKVSFHDSLERIKSAIMEKKNTTISVPRWDTRMLSYIIE